MSESTPPPPAQPPAAAPAASLGGATATTQKPKATPGPSKPLPLFRVLLHNDDHNDMQFVIRTLVELTPLGTPSARNVMMTAHTKGVALVLMTHKERAELYQQQFRSKGLIVTIEPAEV